MENSESVEKIETFYHHQVTNRLGYKTKNLTPNSRFPFIYLIPFSILL